MTKESAMNGEPSKLVSEGGAPIQTVDAESAQAKDVGKPAAAPVETDPAKILVAEVKIFYFQDGHVNVDGPLQHEMLFDFLLKKADEAATKWRANQTAPRIAKVPFMAKVFGVGRPR